MRCLSDAAPSLVAVPMETGYGISSTKTRRLTDDLIVASVSGYLVGLSCYFHVLPEISQKSLTSLKKVQLLEPTLMQK